MSGLRIHRYQPKCVLRASGPDASEFLQGQFSNDLSGCGLGETVYGLWLDRKGKIVADSFVQRLEEDSYLIASYHCPEEKVSERLESYLVMEEVEIEALTASSCALALAGSETSPVLKQLEAETGCVSFRGRRDAEGSFVEWIGFGEEAMSRIENLNAQALDEGATALDELAMRRLAIESGFAEIGYGFGEMDLPQEIGLTESAVSFRKGCYLGQEVMARIRSMGKVRKSLVVCSSGSSITQGLPLDLVDDEGKRQGQLRNWVTCESRGIGLGVVSEKYTGSSLHLGAVQMDLERPSISS